MTIKLVVDRLVAKNCIAPQSLNGNKAYRLTEQRRTQITAIEHQAETHLNGVVKRLFGESVENHYSYNEPFLLSICHIFSKLGEDSAYLITGEINKNQLVGMALIQSALEKVKVKYELIDIKILEKAVLLFFETVDPAYDELKWRIAQNYFVSKIIGMDSATDLISKEIFQKSTLYLDTNIIISALEPTHRNYYSYCLFAKACKQLGIKIKICQISLDELRGWIQHQRTLLINALDQIPKELSKEIRSLFYEIYLSKIEKGEQPEIEDLFKNFENPMEILKNGCAIELDDDKWFIDADKSNEIKKFAAVLQHRNFQLGKFPKKERKCNS